MNKHEESLAAIDLLFSNLTAEEFEKDYLASEQGVGISVEDYLARSFVDSSDITMKFEWFRSGSQITKVYSTNFVEYSISDSMNDDCFQVLAA